MKNPNGLPMTDATQAVTIKIRRQDIKDAVDRNPEQCVVARAMKRTLNGSVNKVKIGANVAYIDDGVQITRFVISKETREMIRAYDAAGFYPSGVSATLLPPSPSMQLGVKSKKPQSTKKNGKGRPNVRSVSRPWLRHVNQDVEQ